MRILLTTFLILISFSSYANEKLSLIDNLQKANVGDYLVTAQNKCFTVLFLREKVQDGLIFDEVTAPSGKIVKTNWKGWKGWIEQHAPGHTCWVTYKVDVQQGRLTHVYSHTARSWIRPEVQQQILSTLLNIQLNKIPDASRKKRGSSGSTWSPPLVYEGNVVKNAVFSAWTTRWPSDGSQLANQEVLIYLPVTAGPYPTYFPYWIQIKGKLNRATVRVVDSGKDLESPMQNPFAL
ncbi:MAG: hypothetical protein WD595_06285 [Waddliaceae bacterium]